MSIKISKKNACTTSNKLCFNYPFRKDNEGFYQIISEDQLPCWFCNRSIQIPVKDYYNKNWKK